MIIRQCTVGLRLTANLYCDFMENKYNYILAKHEDNGLIPLSEHLFLVAMSAEAIARNIGLDASLARKGAILHDIGKASSVSRRH